MANSNILFVTAAATHLHSCCIGVRRYYFVGYLNYAEIRVVRMKQI